jgi:hypothetical protein
MTAAQAAPARVRLICLAPFRDIAGTSTYAVYAPRAFDA